MRGAPVKDPRKFGEHIGRLYDLLREEGATDVRVWKNKHVIIGFCVGRHYLEITGACTPRDAGFEYDRLVRELKRACAAALAGVRA